MQIRTDLALEAREMIDEKRTGLMREAGALPPGMTVDTEDKTHVLITRIALESQEAEAAIGKKQGHYVTLEVKHGEWNTQEIHREISATLEEELQRFLQEIPKQKPQVMVIGLGNWHITPDSLGPKVVEKIVVTKHLQEEERFRAQLDTRLGNVCAVAPGVLGITGLETGEIIQGLVEKAQPDLIFVIDALAARKTSRVNATIQISDTGIVPGSGVGNRRMEISRETLGVPVISLGVPTVVDAFTLAKDLLEDAEGGELEEEVLQSVARSCGADMMVTPKNIDIAIDRMSLALATGLNMAIHRGFDLGDVHEYLL